MQDAAERRDETKHGADRSRGVGAEPAVDDLWRFISLDDYHLPRRPVRGALQKNWAALKQAFRRQPDQTSPFKPEEELRALDEIRLARLLASPDRGRAARALDTGLKDWLDRETGEAGVRFIVGQPYSGLDDIVRHWAAARDAPVMPSPDEAQIRGADAGWLDHFGAGDNPWVLPNLERCFRRHVQGLDLVRRFFEAAESGRLGRGLIACDSWAWAYLQHVWPSIRVDALTLQAFDGADLQRLLIHLTVSGGNRTVCYRNAKSGDAIFTVPTEAAAASGELVQLACHCRGNVGLALEHWRSRLRTEPEVDGSSSEAREEMEEKREAGERVVWVASGMGDPILPAQKDDCLMLLLHALLIHGGLPEALLPELLPFSRARCMGALLALRGAGAVQWDRGRWRVRALAYAAVREGLRGRDYLVDQF
jgi:hypothetical protein